MSTHGPLRHTYVTVGFDVDLYPDTDGGFDVVLDGDVKIGNVYPHPDTLDDPVGWFFNGPGARARYGGSLEEAVAACVESSVGVTSRVAGRYIPAVARRQHTLPANVPNGWGLVAQAKGEA